MEQKMINKYRSYFGYISHTDNEYELDNVCIEIHKEYDPKNKVNGPKLSQYCSCCLKYYNYKFYFSTHIHSVSHKQNHKAFIEYLLLFTETEDYQQCDDDDGDWEVFYKDADDDTIDMIARLMLRMHDYDHN
jgi:hypothetical protein